VQLEIPIAIAQNSPLGALPVSVRAVFLSNIQAHAVSPLTLTPGTVTVTAGGGAKFQSVVLALDGTLQLQLSGTPGKSYILQSSADLRSWSAISTNVALNGTAKITQQINSAHSFYRAVAAP